MVIKALPELPRTTEEGGQHEKRPADSIKKGAQRGKVSQLSSKPVGAKLAREAAAHPALMQAAPPLSRASFAPTGLMPFAPN